MRQIGTINDKAQARLFSDYLYACGIENEIEHIDNLWVVWAHDDDQLDPAMKHHAEFTACPDDPKFADGARTGRERWDAEKKSLKKTRGKAVDVRTQVWGKNDDYDYGPITIGLTVISIGTFVVQMFVRDIPINDIFGIASFNKTPPGFLTEVLQGQVWRILTPMFLHFGILHILFNMLWLKDLGGLVEKSHSSLYFLAMVLAMSASSNLAQYVTSGPHFGGMSGVVYGLFGYTWFRGKYDPRVHYRIPQHVVIMMIVWFFLCWTGMFGGIANIAHTAGLLLGAAWGFLDAKRPGITRPFA